MERKLNVSLHKMYDTLIKEFHPTLNGELKLSDIICGSKKKIWWKCDVEKDHEWESSVYIRILGHGCPCCSGNKVVMSNCLATKNPKLAKEWHPTKNNSLTPFDITIKSRKKVWWKCDKGDDHEWESSVSNRASGNKCPCCYGRKAVLSTCLATTHPHIAKQWHPTKNFPLTPLDVVNGSGKKVWWKCSVADDHEWKCSINNRILGNGCPCCSGQKTVFSNCLAITHPNDAKQWHPFKNGEITPFDVCSGSKKRAWWKCNKSDDHEWQAVIKDKTRFSKSGGCPMCSGKKIVLSNCLSMTHPEIAEKWHPNKNILTPFNVTYGSNKIVWWRCKENNTHEWKSTINNLVKNIYNGGSGCPLCNNNSNGEKKIKNILNDMNVYYETEKQFNDCKYEQKLRFDLYIPEYNALIEYDGIQHFKPVNFWGGIKGLNENKKRDKVKNEYATKNNMPLLRIPYTKFDYIEEEIKTFLNSIIKNNTSNF